MTQTAPQKPSSIRYVIAGVCLVGAIVSLPAGFIQMILALQRGGYGTIGMAYPIATLALGGGLLGLGIALMIWELSVRHGDRHERRAMWCPASAGPVRPRSDAHLGTPDHYLTKAISDSVIDPDAPGRLFSVSITKSSESMRARGGAADEVVPIGVKLSSRRSTSRGSRSA